jgi:hypothetical protein
LGKVFSFGFDSFEVILLYAVLFGFLQVDLKLQIVSGLVNVWWLIFKLVFTKDILVFLQSKQE